MRRVDVSVQIGLALLLAFGSAQCSEPPPQLVVDLRTDWVAPDEVARVRVLVEHPDGRSIADDTSDLASSAELLAGHRVAELELPERGTFDVTVSLLDGATAISERAIRVDVSADRSLVAVLTRNCSGVVCGDGEACVDGACESTRCSNLDPDACDAAPECGPETMCTGPAGCAEYACAEGVCLTRPRTDRCASGRVCDPELDCVFPPGVCGSFGEVGFAWVEIATPENEVMELRDVADGSAPRLMGFEFPYFGSTFTGATVSSNGYLTVGDGTGADAFDPPFPAPATPNAIIAPYSADLFPDSPPIPSIWAASLGEGATATFVVTWRINAAGDSSGDEELIEVQAILDSTGGILFQYRLVAAMSSIRVGVEDPTGASAVVFTDQSADLGDGFSIRLPCTSGG